MDQTTSICSLVATQSHKPWPGQVAFLVSLRRHLRVEPVSSDLTSVILATVNSVLILLKEMSGGVKGDFQWTQDRDIKMDLKMKSA